MENAEGMEKGVANAVSGEFVNGEKLRRAGFCSVRSRFACTEQGNQSRCILSKMMWHHGNKMKGIDHYLKAIRTAYSTQTSPPVCKWPDSVTNLLFRETVKWIIEDAASKLWMDLYIIAMHGTQGKLYRELKGPIAQLKRFCPDYRRCRWKASDREKSPIQIAITRMLLCTTPFSERFDT